MTTLELLHCEWDEQTQKSKNCNEPYKFISLGKLDMMPGDFEAPDENLPPINEILTLVSGKFPLTDYKDLYENSKETYKFKNENGKVYELILDGFNNACHSGRVNRYNKCNLDVLLAPKKGGAYYSKKSNRRKRNKRTKRTKRTKRAKRSSRKI